MKYIAFTAAALTAALTALPALAVAMPLTSAQTPAINQQSSQRDNDAKTCKGGGWCPNPDRGESSGTLTGGTR